MAKRVRYNRGNIESVIAAARRLEADHDLYIYPTAYGYTLQHSKPPFGLQHVVVPPRGLPAYRVSAAGCEVAQAGA